MKTASYWHPESAGAVRCDLCPHRCGIAPGKTGICGVRENRAGTLAALTYFVTSSMALDPIEKKPLYHFHPGSTSFSFGTFGCTFSCRCCQNFTISKEFSRREFAQQNLTAVEAIAAVRKQSSDAAITQFSGVSYTYNEPTLWIETILELAPQVRALGLTNVMVTNGFINPEPLRDLLQYVDAFNIDLKAFDDEFYKTYCGGRLAPVLAAIKQAAAGAHVELTTLVIPTLNDSDRHFTELRDWIANEVGPRTPVHLSRYFPTYKLALPPTPEETLLRARDILAQRLAYVYLGNIGAEQDTVCAGCGTLVIKRRGYSARRVGLNERGQCSHCGAAVAVC